MLGGGLAVFEDHDRRVARVISCYQSNPRRKEIIQIDLRVRLHIFRLLNGKGIEIVSPHRPLRLEGQGPSERDGLGHLSSPLQAEVQQRCIDYMYMYYIILISSMIIVTVF